ncbi:hypothetical protein TTHMIC_00036 [Tetrahymena thermophila SB210]|uniref:Uncharacterized protein n=1 Tax=Tetrahymena thermophila (strain SB210) TaxID=312017 RepID=A0A1B9C2A0_TETTS|nr:hypothetical protein TTHMIC_00036 [Tetrahymena thermophila SB210]
MSNLDPNQRNPLFIKYKTMIEEKDPEFAQITQDFKAQEIQPEELKNALYVKKQRYMSELQQRLRQKHLFINTMNNFKDTFYKLHRYQQKILHQFYINHKTFNYHQENCSLDTPIYQLLQNLSNFILYFSLK